MLAGAAGMGACGAWLTAWVAGNGVGATTGGCAVMGRLSMLGRGWGIARGVVDRPWVNAIVFAVPLEPEEPTSKASAHSGV